MTKLEMIEKVAMFVYPAVIRQLEQPGLDVCVADREWDRFSFEATSRTLELAALLLKELEILDIWCKCENQEVDLATEREDPWLCDDCLREISKEKSDES